jgi:signal transduction histidine kinase
VIATILDLGRLDAGKVQLNIEAVPLAVLLRDALAAIEPLTRSP